MKSKLLLQAAVKYLFGLILVGVLLFLPAGTVWFWNAWLFLVLLFLPILIMGTVMLFKAPELLQKRLNGKEKESEQKTVTRLSGLMFLAGFVVAGLDNRFSWTQVPVWLIAAASAVLLLSYGMYAEVMRENAYLSRTVQIQEGQKIIDTGLYGVIRHPMYTATIFLFLAIPLVLGSLAAFTIFLLYPAIIVLRIHNEEVVLETGLPGYTEYKQRVRYRLIPFIW